MKKVVQMRRKVIKYVTTEFVIDEEKLENMNYYKLKDYAKICGRVVDEYTLSEDDNDVIFEIIGDKVESEEE